MKKPSKKRIIIGAVTVFLLIILVLFQPNFLQYLSSKGSQFAAIISGVLASNTNDYRTSNNENVLAINDKLTLAAQMKAEDMAKKSYFSHIGPTGEKPWSWFEKVGYKYEYAGENLAVDFTESNEVSQAWINSAKHNANLLNRNFTEIGIGIADGIYQGHSTTFVVQFFGKPYVEAEVKAKPQPISVSTSKLSTTTSPTVAVATRDDLPSGVVLGTEDTTTEPGLNWAWIAGTVFLVGIISYGIYTGTKK